MMMGKAQLVIREMKISVTIWYNDLQQNSRLKPVVVSCLNLHAIPICQWPICQLPMAFFAAYPNGPLPLTPT
jgi:hypothetical protein